MYILRRLVLCLIAINLPLPAFSEPLDEVATRHAAKVEVQRLWKAKDFTALDALGGRFTTERARTPSGIWKVGLLSSALQSQVDFDANDANWEKLIDGEVRDWSKAAPKSPFAHMQVAYALVNRAWRKRGTGYAKEVSADGWRSFNKYVEQARIYLESTKSISSQDMNWYPLMANIATWQRWNEPRVEALVKEAMSRYPEYFPTYFGVLDYYSPKWGGSPAKVEWFASRVADTFPGSKGDALYARMYWWAADNYFQGQLVDSQVDCARMLRGMRAVEKEYPDLWNINRFATFAIDCHDKATARRYFDLIGDKPILDLWFGSMRNFLQFKGIANSKD
jgi:hypothetical protein